MDRPQAKPEKVDGRLARGERARANVVEALLSLIQEGNPRPTAPQIAERAGVSRRLLFHHFADLDDLFAELALVQGRRVSELITPIPLTEPLPQRLQLFVKQRARLLEYVAPFRRAAELQEPFSPRIGEWVQRVRAAKRTQVEFLFARELAQLPEPERADVSAALGAACSYNCWASLRQHQGLSPERAEQVMACTLRALLRV